MRDVIHDLEMADTRAQRLGTLSKKWDSATEKSYLPGKWIPLTLSEKATLALCARQLRVAIAGDGDG